MRTAFADYVASTWTGDVGSWNNPSGWSSAQVPNNGSPPGSLYQVYIPDRGPTGPTAVTLNGSAAVASLTSASGYFHLSGASLAVTNDFIDAGGISALIVDNSAINVGGALAIANYLAASNSVVTAGSFNAAQFAQIAIADSLFNIGVLSLDTVPTLTRSVLIANAVTSGIPGSGLAFRLNQSSLLGVTGNLNTAWNVFDVLNGGNLISVAGNVNLSGSFSGDVLPGTAFTAGQIFPVLHYGGTVTGSWAQVNLPTLPSGLQWTEVNANHTLSFAVTPEPSAIILLCTVLSLLVVLVRLQKTGRRL